MKYFAYILLLPFVLFSQDIEKDSLQILEEYQLRPKFGVYGHYSLNFHQTDFIGLTNDEDNCCPGYLNGSGYSFATGFLLEIPAEKYFNYSFAKSTDLSLRLGYSGYDGELFRNQTTDVIIEGITQTGEFKHEFSVNYGTIGIEPGIAYRYGDARFYGGFRLGFHFYDHYYQIEKVTKPSDRGTFLNGKTTRNEADGEISDIQAFQYALNLGAGYEFLLNPRGSWFIQPEVFYQLNLSPIVQDNFWLTHNIQVGVALKYKKPLPPPPAPEPPLAPKFPKLPVPVEPPNALVDVNAFKIDSTGEKSENFNIRVEDFVSLNMRPLLNYIFFDDSSSALPSRYKKLDVTEKNDFDLLKLQGLDAMETYYQVLNILGKRMQEMPDTKVTLIGTNSNNGGEKNNLQLSEDRANSVKNYLVNIWNIDANRINIKARNLPQQPTRQDEPEGEEENRRVEIIPNDWRLVEAVVTIDTMRVVSNSQIQFEPEINSPMGIKNWELTASLDNEVLYKKEGYEKPDADYRWNITKKSKNVPEKSGNIEYKLTIKDSLGQNFASQTKNIPVEQLTVDRKRLERIKDKEFEYYSLILFDFGTTNLGAKHRNVVDIVKDRISDNAKVYIYGYSDRLGEEDINERISNQRARAVARRMNIPGAIVEGKGESELLYDNDLPEGRFYCRTVQIIIETPIEKE